MIHMSCVRILAEFEGLRARVLDERESVVIRCRHGQKVALIGAVELENLVKTAQMLRSPGSAARLVELLNRALAGGCDGA
jgi:PHD/YefM family antitoxin component YafN of YafNO toxin-antitoxin module